VPLYVCEQLGLSPKSRIYSPSLPSLKYYSQNKALPVRFFWKKVNQSQDLDTGEAIRLCSSGYRQALGECLWWGYFSQLDSRIDTQLESSSPAATYILTQCSPHNTDLVRILSQAGARPMARLGSSEQSWPFWLAWLLFLQEFRLEYMKANGSSGASNSVNVWETACPFPQMIFLRQPKPFLRVAQINCDTEFYHEGWSANNLKRLGLHYENQYGMRLYIAASAMFILEECFHREPEFREFAAAIKPLVETPTRKILKIEVKYDRVNIRSGHGTALESSSGRIGNRGRFDK